MGYLPASGIALAHPATPLPCGLTGYNAFMGPDDEICYCYHVPYRKLWNYARRQKLRRPSQMSECLGAGTGCGWCIPVLKRIFEAAGSQQVEGPSIEMSPEEYAERRKSYIQRQEPRNRFADEG